jgi:hypothetical protein
MMLRNSHKLKRADSHSWTRVGSAMAFRREKAFLRNFKLYTRTRTTNNSNVVSCQLKFLFQWDNFWPEAKTVVSTVLQFTAF